MIAYLLQRPVAVLTSFFCVVILGVIAYVKLPVALMPDIESPRLVVQVNYPASGAEYIDRNVLALLRNQLSGLYGLSGIESTSANNIGKVNLTFAYGTDMKLAFIEANEKIDQSTSSLPDDMPRPQVLRISNTDIPVLRLQVQSDVIDHVQLSELSQYVIRRRIEGIPGVARVLLNGALGQEISVYPNRPRMQGLGITENDLMQSIREANFGQMQIKVREGIYEYNVRIENPLKTVEGVKRIVIRNNDGSMIPLSRVAEVRQISRKLGGIHYFQGKPGIVLSIHRQSSANMRLLENEIQKNIKELRTEFPQLKFSVTQNQSDLLSMSIGQLTSSLILGGVLSFAILFLFSTNYKLPFLMGLVLPATMTVTAGIFYLTNLSINIITLSGVILGVGMLIDNAIILIDNINGYYEKGVPLTEACRKGSEEIFSALLSSTFTTLSVFLPLMFLGGIAGTFFMYQAISLSAVLLASLIVAFLLLPVLFKQLSPKPSANSRLYSKLLSSYKYSQKAHRNLVVSGLLFLLILGITSLWFIPASNLPPLETKSAELRILWPDPVTVQGNLGRMTAIESVMSKDLNLCESDIGIHQLDPARPSYTNSLTAYLEFADVWEKEKNLDNLRAYLYKNYPEASWELTRAKNPFDQLFIQQSDFLKVKIRDPNGALLTLDDLDKFEIRDAKYGPGFVTQPGLFLDLRQERLDRINVSAQSLIDQIKYHYQDQEITEIQRTDRTERVILAHLASGDIDKMEQIVISEDSLKNQYPVSYFFNWNEVSVPQFVTADLAGSYQDINFLPGTEDMRETISQIRLWSQENGLLVEFSGEYFEQSENLVRLLLSLVLSVLLLYFILAAQFESLVQPIIILITLPVALSGSLLAILISGNTLNISSLIGMIVVLGIIVNDSILKIDTINRNRKEGMVIGSAVKSAGALRLKPILMTSLTTILALIPLLFSAGIGADLQAPLAIAVIGGLTVGTVCSIYLIPLLYEKLSVAK